MAWRLFGKSLTSEIGINTLACGAGSVGVRKCYDHYFLGVKTGSSCKDTCIGGITNPSGSSPVIGLSSQTDKFTKIAARKFKIEKDKATGWFRWTCSGSGDSGIEPTRSAAKAAGRENCSGEVHIEEIIITSMAIKFDVRAHAELA